MAISALEAAGNNLSAPAVVPPAPSPVRGAHERMQPAAHEKRLQLLQARVAPIPRDLNDLMLAEFTAALPASGAYAAAPR